MTNTYRGAHTLDRTMLARFLTKTQARKRRSEIIKTLCQLSKDSWRYAKPCDYEPLERELREIEKRLAA